MFFGTLITDSYNDIKTKRNCPLIPDGNKTTCKNLIAFRKFLNIAQLALSLLIENKLSHVLRKRIRTICKVLITSQQNALLAKRDIHAAITRKNPVNLQIVKNYVPFISQNHSIVWKDSMPVMLQKRSIDPKNLILLGLNSKTLRPSMTYHVKFPILPKEHLGRKTRLFLLSVLLFKFSIKHLFQAIEGVEKMKSKNPSKKH